MLPPVVYNTSEICYTLGIRHVVLSPGSRNAPLSISFARNEKVKKWVIPDERSAGFVALGIAQKTGTPVALCCTSGTALLNYAPAVAEAFYREIPLVVLSADRPPELIDQRDGQTIRQFDVLKNHVKGSYQLDEESSYQDELAGALELGQILPKGPIHINIPFKEPFYPTKDQVLDFTPVSYSPTSTDDTEVKVSLDLSTFDKIMILVGQQPPDQELDKELEKISSKIPVVTSPLNNVSVPGIAHTDSFIATTNSLQPDLLITSGLSVLSKKLKLFLRENKPKKHVHLDPAGVQVDTFQSSPELIKTSLSNYLQQLDYKDVDETYLEEFTRRDTAAERALQSFFPPKIFSEVGAAYQVLASLPNESELHLGNSMPVRYADMFGVAGKPIVWANRGTSGIDGCTSTALGTSLVSDRLNVLLIGDLSFLYDRNAFFHSYKVPNLRIVILNNQGGGIFRLIDGPAQLPELETYFETRHDRSAKYICDENDFLYQEVRGENQLANQLKDFYMESERTKVLEVFTDPTTNQEEFKKLKQHIHEQLKD